MTNVFLEKAMRCFAVFASVLALAAGAPQDPAAPPIVVPLKGLVAG